MRAASQWAVQRPLFRRPFSTHYGHYGLWVNGEYVEAAGGRRCSVLSPATGEEVATFASAGAADVDRAISEASKGFEEGAWSERFSPRDRCRVLSKAAELLRQSLKDLAELETRQTGRCLREYHAQLGRVPEWFEYHGAYAATKGFEGRLPAIDRDHVNLVWRVPLGVCALITPWNHPMLIAAKKIAVALAAGNSVVVKPPVEAPLTVLRLAELLQESGLPPGVLQVVPGEGPEAGGALARHERVERVDFTGGTETGLIIQRTMAEAGRVRAYCAELGGNAPILVFSDTRSVQEAVDGVAFAAFVASGQTCVSGKRILVQSGIFEEFKERLVQKAEQLRLGDPLKTDTEIGPVISKKQLERIESQVERAIAAGARALTGGRRPSKSRCELADTGHFFEPTVLSEVSPSNPAFAEEIFGPVVSLSKFEAEGDALALANASQYGLGGAIWTEDVRKSLRVARKLRCGLSWVNCHHRNDPSSPWGGFGQSGIGRENGPEAFEEYTTTQSLTIRNSDTAENWFGGASVSELIYQQLLAKKEHSGIDAWYQEYVSEAWQKRNNLQKADIERQAKSCGENTPMWVEALSAGMELAAEVFEVDKAERLRTEVSRDVVLELLESLSPKLCISHYARCGLGQIGMRAVVGVLWHFDTDAEVAGLCADSLRWAIAENEQNRKILLDLHVTEPADEKKSSLSFARVALGAFLVQAGKTPSREARMDCWDWF
ncbi:Betaine aldehyde dehydrogenase [Symbiodinium microadriaticum]|uniref:Betaine aldehyde dehydrogenase n=1 Tax=Symbiodinium microadriaticum TaxID=2951 RepID=A0A1Q9EVJ7_SYMMI|nr:Betaine aldehyde dehydrogenase [Symbiodinium microadriaticum]